MAALIIEDNQDRLDVVFTEGNIVRIEATGGQEQNAKFYFADGKTETYNDLSVQRILDYLSVLTGGQFAVVDFRPLQE